MKTKTRADSASSNLDGNKRVGSGSSGSASVLWSQALCNDYYHAIPAADHDPNATGWIALCGSFCCGTPLMVEETEGREACKTCLRLSSLNTEGSRAP